MDTNPAAALTFPFLALCLFMSGDRNTSAQYRCYTDSFHVRRDKLLPNVRVSKAVVGTYLKS